MRSKWLCSLTVQWRERDMRIAFCMASLFGTGNVPGCPMQISHTVVLGSLPKASLSHPQKSFVLVFIWACTSRPMIVSSTAIDVILPGL